MDQNPGIEIVSLCDENQLELFRLLDARSVENHIKRLEGEISSAMRIRDFRLAANLTQQQKSLIQNQIDPQL